MGFLNTERTHSIGQRRLFNDKGQPGVQEIRGCLNSSVSKPPGFFSIYVERSVDLKNTGFAQI
jgi:hypothetical protein